MSYILDALRKSERERALGKIPSLATQAAAPARRAPGRAVWVLAVCAALAAAAAVVLWLQRPPAPAPGAAEAPPAQPLAPPAARARTGPAPQPARPTPPAPAPATAAAAPLPRLAVLSYSASPQRRFVIVGDTRYVEGDTLPGGYRLESITADGVYVLRGGERQLIRP